MTPAQIITRAGTDVLTMQWFPPEATGVSEWVAYFLEDGLPDDDADRLPLDLVVSLIERGRLVCVALVRGDFGAGLDLALPDSVVDALAITIRKRGWFKHVMRAVESNDNKALDRAWGLPLARRCE